MFRESQIVLYYPDVSFSDFYNDFDKELSVVIGGVFVEPVSKNEDLKGSFSLDNSKVIKKVRKFNLPKSVVLDNIYLSGAYIEYKSDKYYLDGGITDYEDSPLKWDKFVVGVSYE